MLTAPQILPINIVETVSSGLRVFCGRNIDLLIYEESLNLARGVPSRFTKESLASTPIYSGITMIENIYIRASRESDVLFAMAGLAAPILDSPPCNDGQWQQKKQRDAPDLAGVAHTKSVSIGEVDDPYTEAGGLHIQNGDRVITSDEAGLKYFTNEYDHLWEGDFALGLGPKCIQTGDVVVILLGCDPPVVLQPRGDGGFKFVGAVYIQGITESKAMEDLEMGRYKLETFELV